MSDVGTLLPILIGLGAIVALAIWTISRRRRKNTLALPFPPGWRALLKESLPLYSRLPRALQDGLEPLIKSFLKDVRFVGCNGLDVTDEMRLVIATQACLLVVQRNTSAYHDLMSVLLYPEEFVVQRRDEDEAGVVTEFEDVLSGESQDTSRIVLSWQDVVSPPEDGEIVNVVLHEFAHYLDSSVGGDFTDLEGQHESLRDWHDILEDEYNAHCRAIERDEDTLIHPDGAEHPAEFFAYATEVFFEEPAAMKRLHPRLYDGLQEAYGLDPASWPEPLIAGRLRPDAETPSEPPGD